MTAQREIARGDYSAGESDLRAALLSLREQGTPEAKAKAMFSTTAPEIAGSATAAHDGARENSNAFGSAPPCKAEPAGTSEARIRTISLIITVPQDQNGSVPSANGQLPVGQAQVRKQAEEHQMEDEVE